MNLDDQLVRAQKVGAAALVERARNFDQNAIAMIDSVRQNAQAGDERARSAFAALHEYIRQNPPQADMGQDVRLALGRIRHPRNEDDVILGSLGSLPGLGDPQAIRVACVLLARGKPLTRGRITRMHEVYPSEPARGVFEMGLDNSSDEREIAEARKELSAALEGVLCAGYCVGVAYRLQLVAAGKMPVSSLSREVAWELGEPLRNEPRARRQPALPSEDWIEPSEPIVTLSVAGGRTISFTADGQRVGILPYAAGGS